VNLRHPFFSVHELLEERGDDGPRIRIVTLSGDGDLPPFIEEILNHLRGRKGEDKPAASGKTEPETTGTAES
jgi:hypothetical protein